MILVDTSAWVEFQRATGSPADRRLTEAIETEEELLTVGVVVLALLAGARDEPEALRLQRLLARCRFVKLEEPLDEEAAAAIYRACRKGGETVRSLPDCLIAAMAIRIGAQLLHQNSDFEEVARQTSLRLID